jgi:hypothetical protein
MEEDVEMETMVSHKSWRFIFNGGHVIEVECTTWDPEKEWQRMKIPCPPGFDHGSLPMFARGWVACRDYA